MNKPKEKRMIGIKWTRTSKGTTYEGRSIGFDCKYAHIVKQLEEFGRVSCWSQDSPNGFLEVATTYDYDEVLEYIKYLGTQKPEAQAMPCALYPCYTCTFKDRCRFVYHTKLKMPLKYQANRCPFYEKKSTS